MNIEYLLFNIAIIAGPLYFASRVKYGFRKYLWTALKSVVIASVPFLIWDALVTGSHWSFNTSYTLSIRMFNLPPGELLFFITVPFACIFTWEMIVRNTTDKIYPIDSSIRTVSLLLISLSVMFLILDMIYTGLVFISLTAALTLDILLRARLYRRKQFFIYIILIVIFTLVFNGYLTARPIVLYGEQYQIGLRIMTIPVEDFAYGISLMYFSTILFEFFKRSLTNTSTNSHEP